MRPLRTLAVAGAATLLAAGLALAPAPVLPAGATTTVDWGQLSPDGLTPVGASPDDQVLRLYLHPVSDTGTLEATALAVNDPARTTYGQERTVAEAGALAVPEARVRSIVDTLEAAGASGVAAHETRAFVVAEMTIGQAEALFATSWERWTADGLDFDMPSTTPALPAGLDGEVDAVYGAVSMVAAPTPSSVLGAPVRTLSSFAPAAAPTGVTDGGTPVRTGTPDPSACPEAVATGGLLPNQIADAYGLGALRDLGVDGAGVRIAVVDGSRYQPSDLAAYRACLAPDATPITDHVIGTPGIDEGTVEADLDLSVVSSTAPGIERLDSFMVANGNPFIAGVFLDYVAAPFDTSATGGEDPDVVSLSYGMCESLYQEDPMSGPALVMSEQVLATAAAARVSFLVSTGDSGSTGCAHNHGSQTEIVAAYPATSPWVTAVGGTNLTLAADNSIVSTGAWNDNQFPAPFTKPGGGGTGGVSQLRPLPSWQTRSAPSATGRAVPDVALFADEFPGWPMYADVPALGPHVAGWMTVGGTSASTPLTAGLVALVDQVNAQRGHPSLGWMNPMLYSLDAGSTPGTAPILDVTLGTNAVFDGIGVYAAGPGYDLATGLGSLLADRTVAALADPTAADGGSGIEVRPMAATTVALTATPSLPGGEVLSYAWDLDDDGNVDVVGARPEVVHTYDRAGVHRATVEVRTSLGRSATFAVMFSTANGTDGVGPAFTG